MLYLPAKHAEAASLVKRGRMSGREAVDIFSTIICHGSNIDIGIPIIYIMIFDNKLNNFISITINK